MTKDLASRRLNNIAHLTLLKNKFTNMTRTPNANFASENESVLGQARSGNPANAEAQLSQVEKAAKVNDRIKQDIKEQTERGIREAAKHIKPEMWSYSRLKECQPLMKATLLMVSSLVETYQKFLEENELTKQIEWCLFIDNSDSIKSSGKANLVIQCVVVICELLRRLETRFAVARFGDVQDTFALLKSFQTPMSASVGERMIESLQFDQGTLIETCMANICERVWPQSTKDEYQHHVAIVTDGIVTQVDSSSLNETIKTYKINPGFLFIGEPLKGFRDVVARHCQTVLPSNNSSDMRPAFELVDKLLKSAFIASSNSGNATSQVVKVKCDFPIVSAVDRDYTLVDSFISANMSLNPKLEETYHKMSESSMFNASSVDRLGAYLTANASGQPLSEKVKLEVADDGDGFEGLVTKMRDYYDKLEKQSTTMTTELTTDIERCYKSWTMAESLLSKEITEYQEVLQDVVMPNNRYTRKRGDSKGSSLYMPGLIKAFVSDFTYTKIYASKTSGGCRAYSIYLCLDLSYSMNGQLQEFVIQSLLSFVAAMSRMGDVAFTIIVFAETVHIVKIESQTWNKLAIYTLLSSFAEKRTYATADAAALRAALNLCELSTAPGPKKIFIFTDGFTSYPQSLRAVVNEIEMKGIELVAIAVGCDKFFVHRYYPKYVTASLPCFVHKALRALYEMNQVAEHHSTTEIDRLFAKMREASLRGDEDVNKVLKEREKIFEDLHSEIQRHQNSTLAPSTNAKSVQCQLTDVVKQCRVCIDCIKTITVRLEPQFKYINERLAKAGAQLGVVQVSLAWNNLNDLDLHCIDPNGEEIYFCHRKSASGGKLDIDANAGATGRTKTPIENIVWESNPPAGNYRVYVKLFAQHDSVAKTDFEVLVMVNGRVPLIYPGKVSQIKEKILITQFSVHQKPPLLSLQPAK